MPNSHLTPFQPNNVSAVRLRDRARSALAQTLRALGLAILLTGAAQADWVVGPGATTQVSGGSVDLGCVDVLVRGQLTVVTGSSLVGVRSVVIEPGGSVLLDGGRIELAQTWTNRGNVTSSNGGQVIRLAGAGCPLVGQPGVVWVSGNPNPVAIPSSSPVSLALLALALLALVWRKRFSFRI